MFEWLASAFLSSLVALLPPVHGNHTPTCGVPGTVAHPRYVAVFTRNMLSQHPFTFQRYETARVFYATSHRSDTNLWLDCTS